MIGGDDDDDDAGGGATLVRFGSPMFHNLWCGTTTMRKTTAACMSVYLRKMRRLEIMLRFRFNYFKCTNWILIIRGARMRRSNAAAAVLSIRIIIGTHKGRFDFGCCFRYTDTQNNTTHTQHSRVNLQDWL